MEAEGAIHDDARLWAFDTLHGCCVVYVFPQLEGSIGLSPTSTSKLEAVLKNWEFCQAARHVAPR